jgi:serine/threonine protein kinase
MRFSFEELYHATGGFGTKLGEGGFGSVYRGEMRDGRRVAVKQLECIMGRGQKEFEAEVSIIGRINHVHLVQLHGFCAEGPRRLLVYEYLPNGSLDKWLFSDGDGDGDGDCNKEKKQSPVLDWETRHRIALGTARGLAYLHNGCREKIIHCDIKPENILLDERFDAKLSDFGLAKLLHKHDEQGPVVFTTMRGTRGYLAPEWVTSLAISEKSDVYSFGIVLLEIVAGRRSFRSSSDRSARDRSMYLPLYASELEGKDELEPLLDAKLLKGGRSSPVPEDEIRRIVRIALWCIQEEISSRPSIARVVEMLEQKITVPDPPPSSLFAARMHAHLLEEAAANRGYGSSSSSSSYFDQAQDLHSTELSSIQLSQAR